MGLAEWLRAFRALHDRARAGSLPAADAATYRAGRDELARALLAAQHAVAKPGEPPRKQLRASRALQVDVEFARERVRAMTIDISSGGFGVVLGKPPTPGEVARASLRMPGQEPLTGTVRVVDVRVLPGNARAAFAFEGLSAADAERLETLVFDTVLAQLSG
jgi:PilZ domain